MIQKIKQNMVNHNSSHENLQVGGGLSNLKGVETAVTRKGQITDMMLI